jgi:DNA primase small subunit
VTFMEVIKGSKEQMKKVNVRGPKGDGELHPYLEYVLQPSCRESALTDRTALTSLKNDFVTLCLRDQDCFKTERQWETLLSLLPGDRGTSLLFLSGKDRWTDDRNHR